MQISYTPLTIKELTTETGSQSVFVRTASIEEEITRASIEEKIQFVCTQKEENLLSIRSCEVNMNISSSILEVIAVKDVKDITKDEAATAKNYYEAIEHKLQFEMIVSELDTALEHLKEILNEMNQIEPEPVVEEVKEIVDDSQSPQSEPSPYESERNLGSGEGGVESTN